MDKKRLMELAGLSEAKYSTRVEVKVDGKDVLIGNAFLEETTKKVTTLVLIDEKNKQEYIIQIPTDQTPTYLKMEEQ